MKRWTASQALATLAASIALWAIVAALCLLVGSTDQLTLLSLQYRLDPVLTASLVGAALGVAGVVYQAILRNPLADPYLLGASSGAMLLAYLWQFAGLASIAAIMGQQAFAFLGAAGAVTLVLLLSQSAGRLDPVTLLLVGVIVNAVNASIFLLVNAIRKDLPQTNGPLTFLVGGIQSVTTAHLLIAAALVALGTLLLWALAGQLNAATLDTFEARSLGIQVHRLRWIGLIIASLITASAVAISGPIGFVGLVCPHMARLAVGRDVRRLLPVAMATGASILAIADAASRFLASAGRAQVLLPVGVLTGLMGGPFFLYLLWRGRRLHAA